MRSINEKGMALVIIMIILIIIAGFVIAYISISTQQQKQVDSSIDDASYYQAALSGFDSARAYLLSKYTKDIIGWDNELKISADNATTYNPSAGSIQPTPPVTYTVWFQWCRNIDYHSNTYFAQIENNNDGGGAINDTDGILKLTVYGWGGGNDPQKRSQEIMLEGMVSYTTDPYKPTSAVVVGGSLNISGNASITGTNGSVQANGPVTLTGSAKVAGDVTSTGAIAAPSGSIGGSTNPYSAKTNIPAINPADYSYLARYILRSNGSVYDTISGTTNAPPFNGWSWSGTMWKFTGNSEIDGSYFAETDVDISGSPGSASDPWQLTLLATGYIDVSGTPSVEPATGGIVFMAGKDLKMRGGAGNLYDVGLYAAHEQVSLKGTPTIKGVLLAEDAEDICSLVSTSSDVDVDISGNSSITYNGDLTTVLIDGKPYIKVLSFKKRIKPKY
jgi:type II secretory pathway pseudopilin PulG